MASSERRQHPPEREDCTLVAWYSSLYAPRTGGAYDSHHWKAGIAGRTRRRGRCLAEELEVGTFPACCARAASVLLCSVSSGPCPTLGVTISDNLLSLADEVIE